MIPHHWFIEAIGYLAAAANVFVFVSNTMIPLRIAAIVANALFAIYFFLKGYLPLFALNAFMAPINVFRLRQMRRLISNVRTATAAAGDGEFEYEWLRPYMKPVRLGAGFTLHRKGDLAEEAYILVRGVISLTEPGVTLEPGAFFGEMGLFTEENRRTATAVAETDIDLLCVRYDELLELAAQNPQFGFYLMKLMMKRMQHNVELAQAGAAEALKGGIAQKKIYPGRMPEAETGPGVYREKITARDAEIKLSAHASGDAIHIASLEEALSLERFSKYLAWAEGDRTRAIALYTLNAELSEALYTPLQMLEVTLRNRIHTVMGEAFRPDWYDLAEHQLNPRQVEMISKAKQDLTDERKDHAPARVVAALTFGYWTSMLGGAYENLWQERLNAIARRENGKGLRRKEFARPLTPIRALRNRIAHHEPIISWDLPKQYENIVQLTAWLSPPAAAWTLEHCRFPALYPATGIRLAEGLERDRQDAAKDHDAS